MAWMIHSGLVVKMYFQYVIFFVFIGTLEYIFLQMKFMPISFVHHEHVLLTVMM